MLHNRPTLASTRPAALPDVEYSVRDATRQPRSSPPVFRQTADLAPGPRQGTAGMAPPGFVARPGRTATRPRCSPPRPIGLAQGPKSGALTACVVRAGRSMGQRNLANWRSGYATDCKCQNFSQKISRLYGNRHRNAQRGEPQHDARTSGPKRPSLRRQLGQETGLTHGAPVADWRGRYQGRDHGAPVPWRVDPVLCRSAAHVVRKTRVRTRRGALLPRPKADYRKDIGDI